MQSAGELTPTARFTLSEEFTGQFTLDALRVHRVTKHMSTRFQTVLMISEIQDLDVNQAHISDRELYVFDAKRNLNPRKPTEKVDAWYEASLSCPVLDQQLRNSENSGTGGISKWRSEALSVGNLDEQLFLPACQMLKKIDGIGYYTDNEINVEPAVSTPSNSLPYSSAPHLVKSRATEVFW